LFFFVAFLAADNSYSTSSSDSWVVSCRMPRQYSLRGSHRALDSEATWGHPKAARAGGGIADGCGLVQRGRVLRGERYSAGGGQNCWWFAAEGAISAGICNRVTHEEEGESSVRVLSWTRLIR
jgi:hypothetical protein